VTIKPQDWVRWIPRFVGLFCQKKSNPLAGTGWAATSSETVLKSPKAAIHQAADCIRPAKRWARRFTGFHVLRLRVNWPKN